MARRPGTQLRRKPADSSQPAIVVLPKGKRVEIGLSPVDRARRRVGTVGMELAMDARRHGQDLLGELLEKAMRELERSERRAKPRFR